MILKQLRMIIGDIGDAFAVAMANAFCREGDWAIVRWQDEPTLLQAVREEHPDLILLNSGSLDLDFRVFAERVSSIASVQIIALMHRPNTFLEQNLRQIGIHCRQYPVDPGALRKSIRAEFGSGKYLPRFKDGSIEQQITTFLQSVGISANLLGFHFLRSAIRCALELPYCSGSVTQRIYPAVAAELNSTPSRVERSIRHALSQIREDPLLAGLLPRRINGRNRLTNAEFIAFAVEYLRAGQYQENCG
ncbi:MAG: sporulation initiation factor Spo0A C-terminal domain-containing protein [Oscillospiraceae bacterium]|nr:sporulation initiation factor Spo0A C-terminal domain-containing protein [Oscillospiraceae bacterium]